MIQKKDVAAICLIKDPDKFRLAVADFNGWPLDHLYYSVKLWVRWLAKSVEKKVDREIEEYYKRKAD
jgi:hypothetical protein